MPNDVIAAFAVLGTGVVLAVVWAVYAVAQLFRELRKARGRVHWYECLVTIKTGGWYDLGNYQIVSLDHGRTWWNFVYVPPMLDDTGDPPQRGMRITGPADPALVARNEGITELFNSGFYDISRPETQKLFEAAGFEVRVAGATRQQESVNGS